MEGGRKTSDTEREREEEKGDKNKERKKEVGEADQKKDRLESDDKKRRMQIEQEGQAGQSKEKIGKKEKERERLKKIWTKELDKRKALKKQGEEEVKAKNEKHIAKKGHKRVGLLKEMAKKEQREVEARPKMKRKTNEDEDEPEKKTKNTVELKELGPRKNPAEEKGINQKDLKKHLMKIKKQKEESRKQLKEAEYQKEMAKKQKKAAELLLKEEAEFLKVWPKNEKIKVTEDEEELRKTSKDAVEQKGLGLNTHLMRIKKEKEAMRKELKEEELQKEMKKKLKELLKETTQKWQKQAELLTQVIREKDEAELQKVLKEAQNEARLKKEVIKKAGIREMINQEKVTEVELRKTSKDAVEQKGLGLNTHLMRIKKEKEAMRKEMIKGEKDWEKHELAQKLNCYVDQIRSQYYQDMDSAEMAIRQRATALYFIDKLALSVGSEKEMSSSSLHVKNVTLHKDHGKNEYMVEFNFLSKDLIRSYNKVPVTKRVYKNLENIIENKGAGDKLFDLLTTSTLNEYISSLMPGLTSEVFRTYNASVALQKSQRELSCLSNGQADKLLAYNGANHAAAAGSHQQADTKDFEQSIAELNAKIDRLTQELSQVKTELAVWDAKCCFDRKWHVEEKLKATRQL